MAENPAADIAKGISTDTYRYLTSSSCAAAQHNFFFFFFFLFFFFFFSFFFPIDKMPSPYVLHMLVLVETVKRKNCHILFLFFFWPGLQVQVPPVTYILLHLTWYGVYLPTYPKVTPSFACCWLLYNKTLSYYLKIPSPNKQRKKLKKTKKLGDYGVRNPGLGTEY